MGDEFSICVFFCPTKWCLVPSSLCPKQVAERSEKTDREGEKTKRQRDLEEVARKEEIER